MFLFICWWFPRAWARGTAADRAEYNENKRRREAAQDAAVGSQNGDVELGTDSNGKWTGIGKEAGVGIGIVQRPVGYVPPVTPY